MFASAWPCVAEASFPPVTVTPLVCGAAPVVPTADAELAPDVAPVPVVAALELAPGVDGVPAELTCRLAIAWQLASMRTPVIV